MSEVCRVNLYRPSNTQQDTLQENNLHLYNLSDDMKSVLYFCIIPRTLSEIMIHISKSVRVNVKYNIIDKLIELKLLSMAIPDKPTSKIKNMFHLYNIKY